MKNLGNKLINALRKGYCTPQIARLASVMREPSATLHYNIKKLEKQGAIIGYKAVFNHRLIDESFSAFVLLNLSPDEYGNPERIASEFARIDHIESIDIITGDWEILIKVRARDQQEFYELVKNVISRKGIVKIKTLTSLKEIKNGFIALK